MKCDKCKIQTTEGVQCSSCGNNLDFGCANITESGWRRLGTERRNNWKCPSCKSASPTKDPITLDNLMTEIRSIKLQLVGIPTMIDEIKCIREEIAELKSSCQFASDKLEEFTERLTGAEGRIEELERKFTMIETNQANIKTQLASNDQRSRLNNIEIKGIPLKKDENLFEIMDKLSVKAGYAVPRTQINYISRIPSSNSKNKPIIVGFINRYVKEDFIAAARALKTLKAEDLGYRDTPQRVYVNDHLNADSKLLLNRARELAKKNNFNFVWVKFGKIHARKNDTSRTIIINSEKDLNKIA